MWRPSGPAAAAVAAVEAVEDNLSAKAAGNESVDGHMTACDDKIGRLLIEEDIAIRRTANGLGESFFGFF